MDQETMNPAQGTLAAEPSTSSASSAPKKGSPLLVFLTVLLILVGIADVILWGIVGYYLLRNHLDGNSVQPVQTASVGGMTGGAASGDAAGRDALVSYIQEITGMQEQETAVTESFGSVSGTNYTDDNTMYTEISQRTIPLCQQLNEKVLAIVPEDAEISAAHGIYRDYVTKMLNALTLMTSALSNQDAGQVTEANNLINEANDLAVSYQQSLRALAEKRNVSLNI